MELVELIKEYGIWAGLTVYFIYQSRKDYSKVCERLNLLEDYVKHTLMELVKECNSQLEKNNEFLGRQKNERSLEEKIAKRKREHEERFSLDQD